MKHRILFVCLGNICRSPAADAVMHKMVADRGLADKFEIDSAGTYGGHAGELPSEDMQIAGSARGYRVNHRSRQFRREDFHRFDMIIVMDDVNYEDVCRKAPDRSMLDKVYRMAEYCRKFDVDHVPDPYYQGIDTYKYVLDIIEDACAGLLDSLTAGKQV